jgi:hypothetical protein
MPVFSALFGKKPKTPTSTTMPVTETPAATPPMPPSNLVQQQSDAIKAAAQAAAKQRRRSAGVTGNQATKQGAIGAAQRSILGGSKNLSILGG